MELKEMIAELRDLADDNQNREGAAHAAEALALVAWAEERKMAMSCDDRGCVCVSKKGDVWTGETLLGAIQAAKEAYEQSR